MTQLGFGFQEKKRRSIREDFRKFHKENPHVAETLYRRAMSLKEYGVTRWGMKALFEVLRYDYAMDTHSSDEFKMNNNYTALYARMLMTNHPELAGFFETRERKR